MLRRLYSSLPSSSSGSGRLKSAAGGSSGGSLSNPNGSSGSTSRGTRGRSKPSRPFARTSSSPSNGLSAAVTSTAPPSAAPGKDLIGKGRLHRRRRLASHNSGNGSPTHPTARDYTFQPYPLYPTQFALHRALNPPHMPLPVHAGTLRYTLKTDVFEPASYSSLVPPSDEAQGPFAWPQPHSPVPALSHPQPSAIGDHLRVIQTLSHPGLIDGLGTHFWDHAPSEAEYARMKQWNGIGGDGDAHLVRILGEAVVRNTLSSGSTWEETLARLGGQTAARAEEEGGGQLSTSAEELRLAKGEEAMKVALNGVTALLAQLSAKDEAGEDLGIGMDSVRRKRKKKISKHKYKKRRKATRAQRKRLGK